MDGGDRDPIGELRETLRLRPASWDREQSAQPGLIVMSRSILTHVPWPGPQRYLAIARRRGALALQRTLGWAWSFVRRLAVILVVVARWTALAAIRALAVGSGALRTGLLRLWSFVAWSWRRVTRVRAGGTVTAGRARGSRRGRTSPPARSVIATERETIAVNAHPTPEAVDDGERQLEDLERQRLEQRVLALGPDHPDVAVLLQLVAERCAARGATDEAMALYERALAIQQAAFGLDSPALRPLLRDLAELERELGRDEGALLHEARRRTIEQRSMPADLSPVGGVPGAA